MKLPKIYLFTVPLFFLITSPLLRAQANPYQTANFPATNKVWTSNDYVNAYKIILAKQVPVPSMSNPPGQKVFAHLINPENLKPYLNHTQKQATPENLKQRMEGFFQVQQVINKLQKLYVILASQGHRPHSEMRQLLVFSLQISDVGMVLTAEYEGFVGLGFQVTFINGGFASGGSSQISDAERQQGVQQVHALLRVAFMSAEASLKQRDFYDANDLLILHRAMQYSLPRLKASFPPEFKLQYQQKLQQHRSTAQGEQAQALDAMLQELK